MTKTNALPRPAGATVLSLLALVLAALVLPASSLASGPPLVVSPPSLSFEKTTVGNQAPSREVDLYNEGEEEAPIDKIAIEGDDAAAFNVSGGGCGAVYQYQHCGLWIAFMPNSAGEKHATAHIVFKNGRPEETFEISGTAVEPQLTFSPSGYDFGLRRVYENVNAYIQVTNSGEASAQPNNFEIAGDSGSFWTGNSDCWSHSLAPGESCSIQVNFNPQSAAHYEAELRASVNGYVFSTALSGEGGRAVIDASPNPVEFGVATVGATGAVRTVVLTNSGNIAAGFFIGIVAGGDAGSFQLLTESCSGVELQPGASCSAQLRFKPTGAGPKLARLAFFGDSDAGAQIALTGEGVAAAVTLVPSAFDFGLQAVATKSPVQAFAVRNDGSAPLELGGVSLTGADLDQFALAGDDCGGETLAPGAECLVRVRFTPDDVGAKTAKLRVGSASGSFVATLTGTGTGTGAGAEAASDHWGVPQAFGDPAQASPPRPARKGRHRRFARGDDVPGAHSQRPRRVNLRASAIPR